MSKLLEGRSLAHRVKEALRPRIHCLETAHGITPGLAILQAGDDGPSQVYVSSKMKQGQEIGLTITVHRFPADASPQQLYDCIQTLNNDAHIHGMIIQLPLPPSFDTQTLLMQIDPRKDVDGLHPLNMGLLMAGRPSLIPCTPLGCLKLLQSTELPLAGKHAVIVGRSTLVGKPLAHLLLQHNCTVSVIHRGTVHPHLLAQQADILIAATGSPRLITPSWIKPGACVLDVGITKQIDSAGQRTLVGDVDFEAVSPLTSWITPVPGGVGPMTVACLLENTVRAAENLLKA